jgi:diacylglycerol kinase (ATP)
MKTCLIANPAAGRGRVARALQKIRRAFVLFDIVDVRLTTSGGDEARLANAALDDGCDTIVAVGGDGTVAQIAHTILERSASCRLGLIPLGTGNDFAKTLGVLGPDIDTLAALAAGPSVATVDACRVDGRYFVNSCGFGIDPEILAATKKVRWLTGDAVYIKAALGKLFSYDGFTVNNRHLMMLIVSNGPNLGGAFKIAPQSSVCDGLFDVHYFEDAGALRRFRLFIGALRGTHARLREVSLEQRSSLTLEFEEAPQMELDGELRAATSRHLTLECLPGALRVIPAAGFPR